MMLMFEQMQAVVDTLPGKVGVYYACPSTGKRFAINGDMPMEAASVIKLTIMIEAFRQFEQGILSPDRLITIRREDKLPSCGALTYLHDGLTVTVRDLVTLMIILSDNTATNLLIDIVGMAAINQTIDNLQLTGTRLNRKLFRPELSAQGIQNYVTAADMGHIMEMLLSGKLISREASQDMLNILRSQRLNGKLPFFLHSRGIPVAHKTGEDDGITHDVGIIFTEEPCILCFLSNATDVPAAERVMQDMAALVADMKFSTDKG